MLRVLRIREFALIRSIEVEFSPGLNLVTGETGSGKSIVVDALGILVGGRTSQDDIRSGGESAIIEGHFSIDDFEGLETQLREAGIDTDGNNLLIRREVSSTGRNRIYLNNCLATLQLLRSVGDRLVDIHGQHDRQSLLDLSTHLGWLDRFSGTADQVRGIRERYRSLRELATKLDAASLNEQERVRRIDTLRFQRDEIQKAAPRVGEREELETERALLTNRERILALSSEAYGTIYESEESLVSSATRVSRLLQELERFDSTWTQHRETLQEALFKLEDLAYVLRDYASGLDFSPQRLNQVEQRLADIERLLRKYGSSVPDVLAFGEKCAAELAELEGYSDRRRELQERFETELRAYFEAGARLSEKRKKEAVRFAREIRRELAALAMEKTDLHAQFQTSSDPQDGPAERIPAGCGPSGLDRVEFVVAPNAGEDLRPLARIASGGELSRIMLAVKTLCGAGEPKTMVFDEVDAGIGGRVAEAVGRRLRGISRLNQVLCVTHLPQIAAFADRHIRVSKETTGGRTETRAAVLDAHLRREELARMLGGERVTEIAYRHADELLQQSHAISNASR